MTKLDRRQLIAGTAAAILAPAVTPGGRSWAQPRDTTIRLGVLTDFSGPYRDLGPDLGRLRPPGGGGFGRWRAASRSR